MRPAWTLVRAIYRRINGLEMVIPWTMVSKLIVESNIFLIATSPMSTGTNRAKSASVAA